jgi:hypothetical protein
MIVTIVILVLVACVLGVLLLIRTSKLQKDVTNLRAVVENQENYTFLVDDTFEVKESNVKMEEGQPRLLGNVLHCKHSQDTGHCGEGEVCRHCPVRFVISKSFERHDDFRNLEASMELGGGKEALSDVDVCVDGSFICINKVPHMVINVKNVTSRDGAVRPKVLFISGNAALFDKVRTALGISFRVLNADTEHQALHRLLHAADYNFCAVMTDASFYHADTVLATMLNEKKNQLPVYVFAKPKERKALKGVNYLDEDISPEELQKLVASTIS